MRTLYCLGVSKMTYFKNQLIENLTKVLLTQR